MLKQIIETLACKFSFRSGNGTYWADEPGYKAMVAALNGDAETTVSVFDEESYADRYIVLQAVDTSRSFPEYPTVLRVYTNGQHYPDQERLEKEGFKGREKELTTEDVAGFFAGRCVGLSEDCNELPRTYAPGAVESFAPVTIAGDLGERVAKTDDENWDSNHYNWYDLNDVPVGGSVYRISATSTLWLFTRHDENRWEATVVPEMQWATTSHHHGSVCFGALLQGALLAHEIYQNQQVTS